MFNSFDRSYVSNDNNVPFDPVHLIYPKWDGYSKNLGRLYLVNTWSIMFIGGCWTPRWSTRPFFRNRQFAHSESHWIAISAHVTSWCFNVTRRRVFVNVKKDVTETLFTDTSNLWSLHFYLAGCWSSRVRIGSLATLRQWRSHDAQNHGGDTVRRTCNGDSGVYYDRSRGLRAVCRLLGMLRGMLREYVHALSGKHECYSNTISTTSQINHTIKEYVRQASWNVNVQLFRKPFEGACKL